MVHLMALDLDRRVIKFGIEGRLDEIESQLWGNLTKHNQIRSRTLAQYRFALDDKAKTRVIKYMIALNQQDMAREGLVLHKKPRKTLSKTQSQNELDVLKIMAPEPSTKPSCPTGYTWVQGVTIPKSIVPCYLADHDNSISGSCLVVKQSEKRSEQRSKQKRKEFLRQRELKVWKGNGLWFWRRKITKLFKRSRENPKARKSRSLR